MRLSLLVRLIPVFLLAPGFSLAAPVPTEPWDNQDQTDLRFALIPLVGGVHGLPGIGLDMGMGYRNLAWDIRMAAGSELCFICMDKESESQVSVLAGARQEFAMGVISIKTGVAKVWRTTKVELAPGEKNVNPDDEFSTGYGYRLREFEGYSLPIQFDLLLGGRFIGLDFSLTVLTDRDGGSTGFMVGLPLGLLRM